MLQDGALLAVGSLDRESRDTYELVVTASDRGTPQREVRDTVDRTEGAIIVHLPSESAKYLAVIFKQIF